MKRREFVSTTLTVAAAALVPRSARAFDALVEVLLDEPIGEIAPELQGHFTEHIGQVIYDGIWVGEGSTIPNIGGIRKELVEHMRRLNAPVIRWPGGCFADSYNWRDGVGPRAQRPTRTNFWDNTPQLHNAPAGPQKFDPNSFGTAEFMRFCDLCRAQPYLAANVRSLSPHDFDEWVEYCNSPKDSTTMAQLRARDGSAEPYNVGYWGIGNESWGCGGSFRPEEYAVEFRRFTSWVPSYGLPMKFIGSGPGADYHNSHVSWTRGFWENLIAANPKLISRLYGFSMHYYCGTTGQGDSLRFSENEWYQMLWQANVMDQLVDQHWTAMGDYDRERKVKLVVDEWGAWHKGPILGPTYLFSYVPSLRDALVTALTLDIFNRHAEKLAMCNVAQLDNNINTLFLTKEDRLVTTPVFHVFDMYKSHQSGRSVRVVCDAPAISVAPEDGEAVAARKALRGLAGSASLKGNALVLTVVNLHARDARTADVSLRGGAAKRVAVTVLAAPDIHAHNDFDNPHAVAPKAVPASVSGSRFSWTFAPASVTKLEIDLT